jgi:hypothetical protein
METLGHFLSREEPEAAPGATLAGGGVPGSWRGSQAPGGGAGARVAPDQGSFA